MVFKIVWIKQPKRSTVDRTI